MEIFNPPSSEPTPLTPWTSNINGGGYNLSNVNKIEIGTPFATSDYLSGLNLNTFNTTYAPVIPLSITGSSYYGHNITDIDNGNGTGEIWTNTSIHLATIVYATGVVTQFGSPADTVWNFNYNYYRPPVYINSNGIISSHISPNAGLDFFPQNIDTYNAALQITGATSTILQINGMGDIYGGAWSIDHTGVLNGFSQFQNIGSSGGFNLTSTNLGTGSPVLQLIDTYAPAGSPILQIGYGSNYLGNDGTLSLAGGLVKIDTSGAILSDYSVMNNLIGFADYYSSANDAISVGDHTNLTQLYWSLNCDGSASLATGLTSIDTIGNITGASFIKTGGTSSQFLKADGSVDSTTYQPIGTYPRIITTANATTQSAAVSATTLFTPATTGMYRLSIYLQVTRAGSTSSILGGATGVVITYKDGDGNVAQTDTVALMTTAGAIAITSATNTTATNLVGTMVVNAKSSTALQFAIGYTSVGVTSMQYAYHIVAEQIF